MGTVGQQTTQELNRADKALKAAAALLDVGLYEDSLSRSYYAVLHAARAALLLAGEAPGSHRGVRRAFGLHLVNTGLIEKEYAEILTAEQEDRELGDYEVGIQIEEGRARRRYEEAVRFVERMRSCVAESQ